MTGVIEKLGTGGTKGKVGDAIVAHEAALAVVLAMDDAPDGTAYDDAVRAEIAALDAVARARCGSEEAFAQKMTYLVALCRLDDGQDDRLSAILTAVEAWLQERPGRVRAAA